MGGREGSVDTAGVGGRDGLGDGCGAHDCGIDSGVLTHEKDDLQYIYNTFITVIH